MDSPTTTETAIGRKTGITTTSAVKATKMPLSVMSPIRPSGVLPLLVSFTAMPMMIGIAASTTSISWLRRLRSSMPISLPNNRSPGSAADIEALAGELDEDVLQARLGHRETAHPHAGRDQ